jgi:hypothetical protein
LIRFACRCCSVGDLPMTRGTQNQMINLSDGSFSVAIQPGPDGLERLNLALALFGFGQRFLSIRACSTRGEWTYASSGRSLGIEANRWEESKSSTTNVFNRIRKTILHHLLAQPAQQPGESGQRPADMISPDFVEDSYLGPWHTWFVEQIVAVGWPPPEFGLRTPKEKHNWSLARRYFM